MRRFPPNFFSSGFFIGLIGLIAFIGLAPATPRVLAQSQALSPPQARPAERTLDIYFIDTEGGQATLVVTPSGESMLVDTGFAGNGGMPAAAGGNSGAAPIQPSSPARDADRISSVFKQAGVSVLDWMVITHYHGDHVGNAAELANRIPIRHFVDHGPFSVELQPNRAAGFLAYMAVRDKGRAITAKPGDKIPVAGLDVEVVSSAGALITTPMSGAPGAGLTNPLCREAKLKEQDPTPENFESIGMAIRYGSFRLLDLGDLTWNQEHALACPANLLGTFDVFHTTRHGDPHSGAPQMVHAIRARVAVMNNGERKGGSPEYWQIVHDAPGLVDFWQLHRSAEGGVAHNSPEQFLANLDETDHGHNLKMSVRADGSFKMINERNGFTREYAAKAKTTVSSSR